MRLHREGTPTILIIIALTVAVSLASHAWTPQWLAMLLTTAMVVVLGIVLWFFRVPQRTVVPEDRAILAPCDGKVVVIEEVDENEYFKDKRVQVSIFMSPLNVHINFHPISGTTSYYKYHPGKYLVAWHPKSSTENERSTVVVKHARYGEVLFRQIAGALARRICTYSTQGTAAQQGQEFGFIKFGSRVDLLLPKSATIDVRIGDVVQGATTVIAHFNN